MLPAIIPACEILGVVVGVAIGKAISDSLD